MSSSVVRRSLATAVKSTSAVKPTATTTTSKPTKIGIRIQSFGTPLEETLPPYARRVKLPESRVLFTVNRSPHVDKKSREQFSMHTKREYLVLKTDRHELAHKFFWLKRLRILGAQYEVRISCKTRLDKQMLKQHLSSGGSLDVLPSE